MPLSVQKTQKYAFYAQKSNCWFFPISNFTNFRRNGSSNKKKSFPKCACNSFFYKCCFIARPDISIFDSFFPTVGFIWRQPVGIVQRREKCSHAATAWNFLDISSWSNSQGPSESSPRQNFSCKINSLGGRSSTIAKISKKKIKKKKFF